MTRASPQSECLANTSTGCVWDRGGRQFAADRRDRMDFWIMRHLGPVVPNIEKKVEIKIINATLGYIVLYTEWTILASRPVLGRT